MKRLRKSLRKQRSKLFHRVGYLKLKATKYEGVTSSRGQNQKIKLQRKRRLLAMEAKRILDILHDIIKGLSAAASL